MSNVFELTRPVLFVLTLPLGLVAVWLSLRYTRTSSTLRLTAIGTARVLIVLSLLFYLSGPRWTVPIVEARNQNLLIDTSYSISDRSWRDAVDQVKQAIDRGSDEIAYSVSLFGEVYEQFGTTKEQEGTPVPDAWTEQGRSALEESTLKQMNPYQSRIQTAIKDSTALGTGELDPTTILLTDGYPVPETESPAGYPDHWPGHLAVVPLEGGYGQNVAIQSIAAPERVRAGESLSVDVTLRSSFDTQGELVVQFGSALTQRASFQIDAGTTKTIRIGPVIPYSGSSTEEKQLDVVQARVSVDGDRLSIDNRARTGIVRHPPRRVLILDPSDQTSAMEKALKAQGFQLYRNTDPDQRQLQNQLPDVELVLINTPEPSWASDGFEQPIRSYVRDRRGGLLVLPGTGSSARRWMQETSLASMLPVEPMPRNDQEEDTPNEQDDEDDTSDDRQESDPPEPDPDPDAQGDVRKGEVSTVSLMLVIDTSGSMTQRKLDLVREAAIATMETLDPEDRVGVLAFDHRTRWITEPITADHIDTFKTRIAKLTSGGGTRILPALKMAGKALAADKAGIKHMILLSDGQGEPGNYRSVVQRLREQGITVSTVAGGEDVHLMTMLNVAEWGGGKMYNPKSFTEVPQIFTTDAKAVVAASEKQEDKKPEERPPETLPDAATPDADQTEEQKEEEADQTEDPRADRRYTVRPNDPAPFLADIETSDLPPVRGLLPSKASNYAFVPLLAGSEKSYPFMAYRYTGTGVSAMMLSPMSPDTAPDWLSWASFPRFVGQTARFLSRQQSPRSNRMTLDVERPAGSPVLTVTVRVPERQSSDLEPEDLALSWRGPDADAWNDMDLTERTTGRYRARVVTPRPGSFAAFRLTVNRQEAPSHVQFHRVPSTIPKEFRTSGINDPFLERMRENGISVTTNLETLLNNPSLAKRTENRPLPTWPLALLSIVILADIYLIKTS
jgi:uncharacterized protein YegL